MIVHNQNRLERVFTVCIAGRTLRPIGLTLTLGLGLLAAGSAGPAQEPPIAWKTGLALRRQLELPAGVAFSGQSLRQGLASLARAYGVAIFLDRRLDPDRPLDLHLRDRPLEELLREVARHADGELTQISNVLYVGPATTVHRLATLAALRRQDVASLPADVKQRLTQSEPLIWPELAQPRLLIEQLIAQVGLQLENGNEIPLDLWPAVSLPPMTWSDRLTLLLAGFDLTFTVDGARRMVRLVPQPEAPRLTKSYPTRGSAAALAPQIQRLFPEALVEVQGGRLAVTARWEEHEQIDRLLSGQSVTRRPAAPKTSEKLYSLTVTREPAGRVARTVADALGKELRYDPAVGQKLKQPIDLKLENATLEYLLESTLQPLGLSWRLTDDALEVLPAEGGRAAPMPKQP